MALTVRTTSTLVTTPISDTPARVRELALDHGDRAPTGLRFESDDRFFRVAGGILVLNLNQEVHLSNALGPCARTVWMHHEMGHVRDNEAIMPKMDRPLRADEEFSLIMVQGQEFPISQRDAVKEKVRERIEEVFHGLTLDAALKRDSLAEYHRTERQITLRCGGPPAKRLEAGFIGHGVDAVQMALNGRRPSSLPLLAVDGIFGPLTRRRVIEFQRLNSLDPDAIVGSKTRAALGI
jgi:peptidoglycan hydrolase-like protein with peptidoglycan-binding domain